MWLISLPSLSHQSKKRNIKINWNLMSSMNHVLCHEDHWCLQQLCESSVTDQLHNYKMILQTCSSLGQSLHHQWLHILHQQMRWSNITFEGKCRHVNIDGKRLYAFWSLKEFFSRQLSIKWKKNSDFYQEEKCEDWRLATIVWRSICRQHARSVGSWCYLDACLVSSHSPHISSS